MAYDNPYNAGRGGPMSKALERPSYTPSSNGVYEQLRQAENERDILRMEIARLTARLHSLRLAERRQMVQRIAIERRIARRDRRSREAAYWEAEKLRNEEF